MRQHMHPRGGLEAQILQTLQLRGGSAEDIYISQSFFTIPAGRGGPNRRAINASAITHAWVDLDCYKLDNWHDESPDKITAKLLNFCDWIGIPSPTSIIFSGRGYYVKWSFTSFIPRAAAARFVAVLRELVRRFEMWGADPMATDISRILRLCGTRHSGTGQQVTLLHDDPSKMYDFGDFADAVLPHTLAEIKAFRTAAKTKKAEVKSIGQERQRRSETRSPRGAADWSHYHWGILTDLQRLSETRWGGSVPEGMRDVFGFVGACSIAQSMPPHTLPAEIRAWGSQVGIETGFHTELVRSCSSLIERAERSAAGERVTWNGREKPLTYSYKKDTLINMLSITSDEMEGLSSLIDRDEKNRRRRSTGLDRAEWLLAVSRGTAKEEKPWEKMGLSRATWYRKGKPSA